MKKIELSLKQIFLMLAGMILVYPLQANAFVARDTVAMDIFERRAAILTYEQHILIHIMAWIYAILAIILAVKIILVSRKKKKKVYLLLLLVLWFISSLVGSAIFEFLIEAFSKGEYASGGSAMSEVFSISYYYYK